MQVTVIIPYNKDRGYLAEAIKSVEKQTVKAELILSKSDKSVSYNINKGLAQVRTRYVRFCSEDNLLTGYCIEKSLEAIKGVDFIHGNAINFWANGATQFYVPPIKHPTLQDMIAKNVIHGGTVMYDMECFNKFGGFDERLWCGEEYELNMRFMAGGCKLGYCDSFLQRYRRHGSQKSLGNTSAEYQAKRQVEIRKIRERYKN